MGYLAALLMLFDVGSPKPCETDADCFDSSFGGWCNPETMQCGYCTDDEQCEQEDAICENGGCVVPCADAMDCDASAPLCDPDAGHCVGCLSNDDCPAEQHCTSERCVDDICTPGELGCQTGDVAVCDEDGAGWSTVMICAEGTTCVDAGSGPMCVEDPSAGTGTTGGTAGPPDGGETADVPVSDGTGGPTGEPVDDDPGADDSGCGCTLSPSPAAWGFGPLLLLLVRTRRRRDALRP